MSDDSRSPDSHNSPSRDRQRRRERDKDRDRERDKRRDKNRDLDWDIDRDVDRDLDRNFDRDLDRELNRDVDRDVDRDINRNIKRDIDRGVDRDIGHDLDRDRDRDRDNGKDRTRDRDRDLDRDRAADRISRMREKEREKARDNTRDRDLDRDKDRDRDRDRDRERDRDRPRHHEPRDRDPPPIANKRNSITGRLFGSFREAKNNIKDAPPAAAAASSISRRSSTATNKGSPVLRIREWLDTCGTDHNHHCAISSGADITTWHPIWLVDVVERRIVRAAPKDRYMTLSYVWGLPVRRNTPQGQALLLRANLQAWQDVLPENDMPQTFLDAMWLAKKLGIRHIWIDKLCIVQDDPEEMDNTVRHMAYVFANSYLTIVAASGDAHTGLTSLNPRRSVRGMRSGPRDHQELILASPWNSRGWTLVERLYARRGVYFFEDAVTWECHCETWQGSPNSVMSKLRGKRQECTGIVHDAALAFEHSPWPDMDEYARIVMDFSSRKLALADDTLRAFSGITNVLSRTFPGGFVFGMPIMFLDIALLWRPHASIRRRAISGPPFLPSWSWMGWWYDNIPVDLSLWRASVDYVEEARTSKRGLDAKRFKTPYPFKIRPLVTWNFTDRNATVPVHNTGLQFRDLRGRRSPSSDLPPGWSRSGAYFKHDSDATALFKYPVPVEDPPEVGDYEPPAGEQAYPGPLLSFRTTCALFEVDFHSVLTHRGRANPPLAVGNIWTKGNKWAGQFRAHDAWLGVQTSNYEGDERIEFIAISEATERRGSHVFDPERFDEFMDVDEMLDIMNVLWIERIGEIVYRRGIGHVLLKVWEAHARDEVDILLG